ncbi:MAG: DUF58 domain-containing protein [Clostridia bacterium]|jgi:uncharacterized protein (DUF58 family)|nr:DUF58 domain-containing protein [Clostridiaceae bacterium]
MFILLTPIVVLIVLPWLFWQTVKAVNRYIFNRLEYSCRFVVNKAHEGDVIYLIEEIHNNCFLPAKRLMTSIHASRWLEFATTQSTLVGLTRVVTSEFSLKAYERIRRTWYLRCAKRGVYEIKNNTLTLASIFGLSVQSAAIPVNTKLIVYPEIVDLRYLILSGNDFFGDTVVRRWILDDPFITAGAREYLPGDPMNRIHWAATARQNTVMVRKNDYTAKLDILVLLNIQSRDNEYEDVIDKDLIEYGIKVAATVFDLALKNGARIQFGCNAGTEEDRTKTVLTESDASSNHIQHLLTILSGLVLKNVRYFEEFLKNATENKRDAEILILTSYMNLEMTDIVRDLIRARNRVKILMLDPYARAFAMPVGADLYYV